jgi:outer membrane protein
MKKKIALFFGLLLVANVSYAELKIGVVNVSAVLAKSPQLEEATKRFEQKFSSRRKQLEKQQKDIQTLDEKLSKDAAVMSDSEKANMEKDLQNKIRDAKRSQQEFSEDANATRNEELSKLQRRVDEIIQKIAKEQSFDLILTEQALIHANEKLDITSQVQQRLLKPE